MIVPYTQNPYPSFLTMQFVVRSALSAERLVPELRRAMADVDRSVPISHERMISELVGETSANARFAAGLMTGFGAAALALAMIGVYGLVAFTVQQRRQEFGVRRALGAAPREMMRWSCMAGRSYRGTGGAGGAVAITGGSHPERSEGSTFSEAWLATNARTKILRSLLSLRITTPYFDSSGNSANEAT